LLAIVALGALALAQARSPLPTLGNTVQVGQSAPAFLIDTLDGRSVNGNFNGRPAYINVFATWCPPCRGELPSIVQQARTYRDRIEFLLVDEQEPANTVKNFASQFGVSTGVAVDPGQFGATFDVRGLPESIFIDRHGVVQFIYLGKIPPNVLDEQLSKLASS
jgi:cytochrome c biogenesis protein CcmG, thiol:disulfide interchange protein DsbE